MGGRPLDRVHEYARYTLAGIRLFNGVAALVAPNALARQLGVDPQANRAAIYVLRLFGTRTVLIGAQLLLRDGGLRAHALRAAPAIHALDATAALLAGNRGQLPRGAANTAAVISTFNTVLAVLAQRREAPATMAPASMFSGKIGRKRS